jgi:hypothetical protein
MFYSIFTVVTRFEDSINTHEAVKAYNRTLMVPSSEFARMNSKHPAGVRVFSTTYSEDTSCMYSIFYYDLAIIHTYSWAILLSMKELHILAAKV